GLGVNFWIAVCVIAPCVVAAAGVLVGRTVIRFLYGRLIDTMLATWGVSLIIIGLVTAVFGNRVHGVSAPLPSFSIGTFDVSYYGIAIVAISILAIGGLWALLRLSKVGLIIRATMLQPEMAAA